MEIAGLRSLSADVIEHKLFSFLPASSLISASMVCRQWRSIVSRKPPCSSIENEPRLLESLYKDGVAVVFLEWFEKHLRYPIPSAARNPEALAAAAEGLIITSIKTIT
jgi:hypothetical protein